MFSGKKTVSSILAAFTKTIEDLEGVKQSNMDAATEKRVQADQLKDEAEAHITEARQAKAVADNLRRIIGKQ